jgi:hypothetical protein
MIPLPWSDASLSFTLPAGGLPLVGALVVVPLALLVVLYRYELRLISRPIAWALLGLRLGVFGGVLALVCLQPIYARDREVEEPGRVLVFVDRSASMEVRDPGRAPGDKLRLARKLIPNHPAHAEAWIARWVADHEAGRPPTWLASQEQSKSPERRRQLEAERRQLHARLTAAIDDMTRTEMSRRLLAGDKGLIARWSRRHTVEVFAFDRVVRAAKADGLDELFSKADASQDGTDLRLALERARERATAGQGKVLAVVLLTDGQHNQGAGPAAEAATLGRDEIPIHSIALGDRRSPPTLSVVSLRGPDQTVFKGVDVIVEVEAKFASQKAGDYVLELARESADGGRKILDTRPVVHDGKDRLHRDRFEISLDEAGPHSLAATVRPARPEAGWIAAAKDQRSTTIDVVADRASVLLVDGEARWEYHYLETALKRDALVTLDRVVFDQPRLNDRLTPQQEKALDLPGRRWPDEEGALEKHSLVILGDVAPARLTLARRNALEKFVGDHGGTLVVVAGKRFMPRAYPADDPLERLLPVEQTRVLEPEGGFALSLTRAGTETPFMRLDAESAHNATLWAGFPRPWPWAVAGRAKPGAAALAGRQDLADLKLPLDERERRNVVIARHNYGFGRVLFVGLDSTWRWRFRADSLYHHRFWGQVVRWAADRPLGPGNRAVRFGTPQAMVRPGDAVEVMARLKEQAPRAALLAGVRVVRLAEAGGVEESVALLPLTRAARPNALEGRLRDLPPGRYALEVDIPALGGVQRNDEKTAPLRATFAVVGPPSRELIDLECNETLLRQLAVASNGRVFRPDEADELESLLAGETVRRVERQAQPLWRWWVVLAVLVALLSAEWGVRKAAGLP